MPPRTELAWPTGTFPTGFIKLRSARRMEHKKQSFCVGRNKEPHLSYHACTLLSESVADWPGHFTLSFTPTELFSCWEQDEMPKGIFLSTNGHSALVDLWPHCDSGRQAWAAIKSQQPGHWHCNVMGGNTQDSVRVQLSCGLADCAGEAVDLWSEHAWILKPLQKNCSTSKGNCTALQNCNIYLTCKRHTVLLKGTFRLSQLSYNCA